MESTSKPALRPVPAPPSQPPASPPLGGFLDFPNAARQHAKAARCLLADAEVILLDAAEDAASQADLDRADTLVAAAQAHASLSLAFTQLSPPARRRPMPKAKKLSAVRR